MANILIIDDDIHICKIMAAEFSFLGHEVTTSFTLTKGRELAINGTFDVVFLDVGLPDGIGLDILPAIRQTPKTPEVIIMTGAGDADGAEMAIRNGAWDYIQKPSSIKQMTLPLIRALEYRKSCLAAKTPTILNLDGIVGSCPQIRSCFDEVAQSAVCDVNVLITGETGTGKEVFSYAIHRNSNRAKGEFIVVDCASLTETLVESTLFGHEKGAFTGADKPRAGLIMSANKGTLFLDEVGELSLTMQRALLRVLQERRFRPVGGDKQIESDFRLIAATNRNLEEMVAEGLFRNDLLHRLKSIVIHLPPLRERKGDVRELATYFVARICDRYRIKTKGISPDFLDMLSNYSWPGNVRELLHTLEQIIARSRDVNILYPEHLSQDIRISIARSFFHQARNTKTEQAIDNEEESLITFKDYKKQAEEKYLTDLIRKSKGDVGLACKISGMSRSNLYILLKNHDKSLSDRSASPIN